MADDRWQPFANCDRRCAMKVSPSRFWEDDHLTTTPTGEIHGIRGSRANTDSLLLIAVRTSWNHSIERATFNGLSHFERAENRGEQSIHRAPCIT
jgi:hypothetical protein